MAMSKKHYEEIAAQIAEARNGRTVLGEKVAIDIVAARLANVFAEDNPRFNRGLFLAAAMKGAEAGHLPEPVGEQVSTTDSAGRRKPAAKPADERGPLHRFVTPAQHTWENCSGGGEAHEAHMALNGECPWDAKH